LLSIIVDVGLIARKCKVSKQYLQRIKRFLSYLFKCGVIIPKKFPEKPVLPSLFLKFKESLKSRGLSNETISSYERSIYPILSKLNKNPKKYNTSFIRQIIINAAKKHKRGTVKN